MKIISRKRNKALVGIFGVIVALLALPFGSVGVYADQVNGYWLTTTTSATPGSVYLKGAGTPDVSTITVNVRGRDQSSPYGSDVILIIDASGSMSGQPTTDEIIAAKSFINSMDPTSDQVSVIPFASNAPESPESIQTLTADFNTAKSYVDNIENLTTLGPSTSYEDALNAATAEFASSRARSDANKVLIFMSDGVDYGLDPTTITTTMKSNGINIYSIGLDSSIDQSGLDTSASDLLKSMASSTNGTNDHYFEAPTSDQLSSIYASISQSMANLVATNVQLTLKLSDQVELVAGSWSITPTSSTNGVYVFDLPDSLSNRTNSLTFNVKVPSNSPLSAVQVFAASGSAVSYTDFLSVASTVTVNNQSISVIAPVVPTVPNTAYDLVLTNPIIAALAIILVVGSGIGLMGLNKQR